MTGTGAPQIGTLDPYVRQEAETIAWESGVETEPATQGGMNVGFIDNGDYLKVKGVGFGAGASSFTARVASGASGGKVEVRLDSATGTLAGTCTVAGTGGWQAWTSVTCPVSGATGTHDLYLRFTGGSGYLMNLDWWQFAAAGDPTTEPPPPSTSPPPAPTGGCSADYRTTNTWSGGFQGEVTVTAGSAAIAGWTVRWPLSSGQTISQAWNGTLVGGASTAAVSNASWNGALGAGASTTFGFIASGPSTTPVMSCAVSP
jgi:cellulase/cellobiase CelA1